MLAKLALQMVLNRVNMDDRRMHERIFRTSSRADDRMRLGKRQLADGLPTYLPTGDPPL
ncbi:hypothetical protein [Methylorubrum thiocyanatum]|uniref:hypothetical protein n=1 Tax=Methylorubrum thiocyanatum TaxID=47958 RepID=UPI003F81015F